MAVSSTTVWQVRWGGSGNDDNGGGFDPAQAGAGTDYTKQAAAQVALDGATITATTSGTSATITLVGVTGVAAHVGNYVHITGGTGFTAGWYRITNYSASTWVLDRNCCSGASSGMTGKMGGALNTPGMASGVSVASNTIWVEEGDYPFTSTSGDVSGGYIIPKAGPSWKLATCWRAHATSDRTTQGRTHRAHVYGTASYAPSYNFQSSYQDYILVEYFRSGRTSTASSCRPFYFSCNANGGVVLKGCAAYGATATGNFYGSGGVICLACESEHVAGVSASASAYTYCLCIGCTCVGANSAGVSAYTYGMAVACVAADLGSGVGSFDRCPTYQCVGYNSGRGFGAGSGNASNVDSDPLVHVNGLAELATTYGFYTGIANRPGTLWNCAGYRNASGNVATTLTDQQNFVSVAGSSGSTMADPANRDWRLNTTAGLGALLRAVGWSNPGLSMPTAGLADIGIPTGAAASSAGGGLPILAGSIVR